MLFWLGSCSGSGGLNGFVGMCWASKRSSFGRTSLQPRKGPLHGKTIRLKVLALSGGFALGMEGVKKYGLIDTSKDSQGEVTCYGRVHSGKAGQT